MTQLCRKCAHIIEPFNRFVKVGGLVTEKLKRTYSVANAIEGGVQRDPAHIQVMYLIMLYHD